MPFKAKILLTVLAIVAFDATASSVSRILQFDYTRFVWLSFLLYVLIGYWGAYHRGFVYGVLLGTFAGLADSTLGWFVSNMIRPFVRTPIPSLRPSAVAIVVVIVTATAFLFGSVGAAICKLFGQTRSADA